MGLASEREDAPVALLEQRDRAGRRAVGDEAAIAQSLEASAADRTTATLSVSGPWLIGLGRSYPHRALARLHALVQTAAEL